MKDEDKTKDELINQLVEMRQRIAELKKVRAERKEVEERNQQQNKFLRGVLESLTHPFCVIDANDYTIKMANSAACFGKISRDSMCYTLTHQQSQPCRGPKYTCPLEEMKKTKKPTVVEHTHYDKDGNARNVEVHGYPIFDSNGNLIQMIEYCLDIAERKRVEEALRRREQEFKALVENTPDVISRFNKEIRHVYINPAVEQETGRPSEAFIGKTNREIGMPEALVVKWHEAIKSVFKTGRERTIETKHPTPGGIKSSFSLYLLRYIDFLA